MADDESLDLEKPAREIVRGGLRGAWDFLWGLLRAAETPEQVRGVLILGPGGTGKTTFARLLSGDLDWLTDFPGKYEESADLERFALTDDPGIEVVVAPGQPFRRPSTWPELLRQVAAGDYRGVVLMNAYGYHTFSTPSYKNHQLYTGAKPEFERAYYSDRKAEELRVLRQLAPYLSVCPKKVWLLSVVAKQDLWWGKHSDVVAHYERGSYSEELRTVSGSLGDNSFRHEFAYLSLIIRNLETLAGEPLKDTEAGYDMRHLVESLRKLINVVAGLKVWEERQ